MLLTIFIFVILFCDTHSLHFESDLHTVRVHVQRLCLAGSR